MNVTLKENIDIIVERINQGLRNVLLNQDRYDSVVNRCTASDIIHVNSLVEHIKENGYTHFIPPQSFKVEYNGGFRCITQVSDDVVDISKFDVKALANFLEETFKIKSISGYYGLVKNDRVKIFTYLPFYNYSVDFDIYGICDEKDLTTHFPKK